MYTEQLNNDQSLALIITKLEESMAGTYHCSASYANTELLQIQVKIETFGKFLNFFTFLIKNLPTQEKVIKN